VKENQEKDKIESKPDKNEKQNKSNKLTGLKEANNSSEAKNGDQKLNGDIGSKTNKEQVDQVDQSFLEELERLKRQANEADDVAKTLRKTFAQGIEDLLLQAGASRSSSTNYVNTASTLVNTASTPVNTASIPVYTASPSRNITSLEDIYEVPNDEIFAHASYDDEGAVADFINLESTVNEELLQFKTQPVWILVELPFRKKGHRQEEGIDYDEVFAPVARIEVIKIFLAFASYMGFIVYQMDVKSAFLYGKIDKELYVSQPSGFIDPKFPKKVYKVVKALYGLHQAHRAWYATLSTFLVKSGYRKGIIDNTLFIKKDKKDIMPVQVYVDDIIFGSTKKSWCDEFEALMKSRFQMSSMGELTFFLDYRFQVTPKTSHLYVLKRIFRYLKGQAKVGLWYPRESSFDLEAYSDSDYAEANLDRKSTTRGCQFLSRRLFSWQCKKQAIIATSTTEAEHHFIRDAYEKKLIHVLKIHTDDNVADLLIKAFDVSSKDFSNPLMADSLPKNYMVLNSPWFTSKELASPKQMALGKDFSNPLMANSLPKTIWLSMHHVIAIKHWPFQSKRLLQKARILELKRRYFKDYRSVIQYAVSIKEDTVEGKGIGTDELLESNKKLVPASKVVREDPGEPIRVPYMINGKIHYITNDDINAHLEKEDKIKKASEEAKMFEMTKTGMIKDKFKKAQDAKHLVLKREHSRKAKRAIEFRKKMFEQYMWTTSSRLKPEPITNFKIHPNTKPTVLTIYRVNDRKKFQAHNPFKLADFGVTELDELGPIIQKKKNTIVKDLMTSLGKRYERLKKIPKELMIQSALPTPVPEQATSKSSGRKRKHMELEPEIKVPGLECNKSLPEGVSFVKNMVIKEPGYGIFFIDVFADQAFQRWNDIHKVGVDSHFIPSNGLNDQDPRECQFSLKLRKFIVEHLDQEKLE
nr:putative ribonuclease H-like domain-containing protein [Tanacetum cinerariifolium]